MEGPKGRRPQLYLVFRIWPVLLLHSTNSEQQRNRSHQEQCIVEQAAYAQKNDHINISEMTDIRGKKAVNLSNRTHLCSLKPVHYNDGHRQTHSVSPKCTVEVTVLDTSWDVKTQGKCNENPWTQEYKSILWAEWHRNCLNKITFSMHLICSW